MAHECTLHSGAGPLIAAPLFADDGFRSAIEADWARQEKRLGREPGSPRSIEEAITRGRKLLADLRTLPAAPDLSREAAALDQLARSAETVPTLDPAARLALFHQLRWFNRELAMKNPLLQSRPIVFLERRRFICQMLHEYMAYYYDNISGGGVRLLENPGRSFAVRDLTGKQMPEGNYTTLALSHDAKTLYFAFARRDAQKPNFYDPRPGQRFFHLYAMDAAGGNLRQISDGQWDDFDPCPLPDGGLAFMSSRRGGGFVRCNNPWEPLPACTLHRMDADGRNVRTLSYHETNEWHPSVLNDGRIVYIRWDYVDRSAANFHGLWVSNADGTNPAALFGNYTMKINAFYQPRAIPGSDKIAFIAGAHHADVGGSLALLDPRRASLDPRTGEDRLDAVEVLTPEICFPESDGWPKSFFHAPWPLSENYFLAGFGYDKLPGMSSGNGKDSETGLYYFDRFGNLELLYQKPGISCMYPIPLAPRARPPVAVQAADAALGDEAELLLRDVRQSLMPMPADRPVKELRIFQILPKTTHIANDPRIGHANAESARLLLGTVPVEADGSAYFRVPAKKPIYFQAVDGSGRAVQTMRSLTYLQPGERRACIGCHEPQSATPPSHIGKAFGRAPSQIKPGPDGSRPMSYPRLVQPVLDAHCVRCHDGSGKEGIAAPDLTGRPSSKGTFTRSYDQLRPHLRWYEWGDKSITQIATHPGRGGADESALLRTIDNATHQKAVKLPAEDRLRLTLWLDSNVPFYGVYEKEPQAAQRRGEKVAVPEAQ